MHRRPPLRPADDQKVIKTARGRRAGPFLLSPKSLHSNGRGGIRTHGTLLTYTSFPGLRLKPLGHPSNDRYKLADVFGLPNRCALSPAAYRQIAASGSPQIVTASPSSGRASIALKSSRKHRKVFGMMPIMPTTCRAQLVSAIGDASLASSTNRPVCPTAQTANPKCSRSPHPACRSSSLMSERRVSKCGRDAMK